MTQKQFSFEVRAPEGDRQDSFIATVHIPIEKTADGMSNSADVLGYIRSIQLKQDFMSGWVRENASNYGLEITGGPRPVFETPGKRETPVIAYEQDFRLRRSL